MTLPAGSGGSSLFPIDVAKVTAEGAEIRARSAGGVPRRIDHRAVRRQPGGHHHRRRVGWTRRQAGLRVGDRIVTVDGKPVEGADDLSGLVQTRQPGDTVEVVADRNGSSRRVKVRLGTRPAG